MQAQAASSGGRAGLVLRAASEQDAPAMHQLTRAAYQPYLARIGREAAPVLADYSRLRPPTRAWVLEQDGGLVGVLVCEVACDHLLIENIAVDAAHRGECLGALLLERAEQHARGAGLPEVRLYTNAAMTENIAYYPRRGYQETHRADQDGYRRVFFTKAVTTKPR